MIQLKQRYLFIFNMGQEVFGMKKILSAALAMLMAFNIFSADITVFASGTDISSLTDYAPPEKYPNVIDPTHIDGFTYLCINNNATLTYDRYPEEKLIKWYVKDEYDGFKISGSPSQFGFEGFEISPPRDDRYKIDFEVESGKTYVVSARIKNNGSSETPYFGASMNSTWDGTKVVFSNEYGKDGMAVTGNDWKEFKASITLPDNYVETAAPSNLSGGYYKRIYLGLAKNMPKDTSFSVDVSNKDSFYVAEEQPYNILLETDGNTVVTNKNSINLSSCIINQIGIKGGLDQTINWYAVKGDRSAFEDKITFSDNGDGSVTANFNALLESGEYIIAAKSAKYPELVRTVKIAYEKNSLEDKINAIPNNLIPNASSGHGGEYLQRNCVPITFDGTQNENGKNFNRFEYTGSSNLVPDTKSGHFGAFELNAPAKPLGFVGEAGKTYVFGARVRKYGTSSTAAFGIAMNDTWDPAQVITSNTYGKAGMTLTSEWQDFKDTLTLPATYNNNALGIYSNAVYCGLPTGSLPGSGFDIDVCDKDSIYFAEEVPYCVLLKCEKKDTINVGDEFDISAEVVNQLGIKGTLAQDIKWYCLNNERTEAIPGVIITKTQNGAHVKVESIQNADNMIVVAANDTYGLVSSIGLSKDSHKTIYVSNDGDDANSGTYANPLKTISGAKNKVNALKASDPDSSYDVVFRGGEYKFDSTISFSSADSANDGYSVIYRAEQGEKVIFSGAASLDITAAKKVTDETVLSRLKENVRDKVYEIDLNTQNLPYALSELEAEPSAQQLCGYWEYPALYLGGNEQPLSEWPNGRANYTTWKFKSSSSFGYSENDPSRWSAAKDWWVGGYLMWDYQYVRLPGDSVDTSGKTINVKTDSNFYMKEGRSDITHRYKVFNLLEEIDVPGEWYIDKNSMKLYYYMPHNDGEKLELSMLISSMLELRNLKNVTFKNIEFTKTRGNAVTMTDSENVNFKGCTFTDIGVDAIKMTGSVYAETDRDYWQRQFIDAAYNCEISDCIFYNIGGHAAVLDGGNVDTLAKGNNVIKNCILSRISDKICNYDAILVKGCGNSVLNNSISRTAFQAIRHYGNDHTIAYNEFYNARQESDDTGIIYCGRNTLQRGSVISHNYIHDVLSTQKLNFKHIPAIYWDDGQSGITAEKNIIVNAEMDIYTNGVDNNFSNNISVKLSQKHWYFKQQSFANVAASNTNTEQKTFGGHIANEQLYYSTYPNLSKITSSDLYGGWLGNNSLYKLNVIKNNLSVDGGNNTISNATSSGNSNVTNNKEESSYDVFVNPSNGDYRVKNSSKYGSLGVLNEDFDINSIGIISGNSLPAQSLTLTAPYNGEVVDSANIHFVWNDIAYATKYIVEVSDDSSFSNIVASQECYYNYADITLPKADGTRYYWRVTAKNTSNDFGGEVQSGVYGFDCGEKISVSAIVQSDNTIDLKITNNYYSNGIDAFVAVAEYDADKNLVNAQSYQKTLALSSQLSFTGKKPEITNPEKTKTVKLFIWDMNYSPLKKAIIIK